MSREAGCFSHAILNRRSVPRIPYLSEDRYVCTWMPTPSDYTLAKAQGSWSEAIADGSVRVYGAPDLVLALPTWFMAIEPAIPTVMLAAPAGAAVA